MQPRITDSKKLMRLPWPDEIPILTENDLHPYLESKKGRRSLHEWVQAAFPPSLPEWKTLHDQFLYVLYMVIRKHADRADALKITLWHLPTPSNPKDRQTKAFYSAKEVAAWWNEALSLVGYDIDED